MASTASEYREELIRQIRMLPEDKLKEVFDFTCYIRAKEAIDPTQAYFWTSKWQEMERAADKDRNSGNTMGDGSLDGLIEALNK